MHKINFHQIVSSTKQNYDTKNRIGMIMGGKEVEYAGAQQIGISSLTEI